MPLSTNQFYCVSCRKRVTLKDADICVKVLSNRKTGGTPALRGKCSCGTNMTKFIARDKEASLTKKFGKCKGSGRSRVKSPKKTARSKKAGKGKKSPKRGKAKKSTKASRRKKCKKSQVRSRKTGRCRKRSA